MVSELRPHFDRLTEEWWETTKLAYELYPEIVTLTGDEVRRAVRNLLAADVQLELLDGVYRTYSRATFERVIGNDTTNRSMAWRELYDCDDFAWQFKARMRWFYNVNAVGFVIDHSAGHAYNLVIFGDGTASLLEPQSDRFVAVGEEISFLKGIPLPAGSSGRYSLNDGMVII